MWERIYKAKSQYQVIELFYDSETGHIRLDLNCCTQFLSADEFRYHELAIFSGLITCKEDPKKVLILGGGDGLAAREALKFAEKVTVVDIDPEVTKLACENELMRALNKNVFNDERVKINNADAYKWIKRCRKNKYDIVFADYPDPSSLALEKLFTERHYQEIKRVLKPGGTLVVQSGGALMLPVIATIRAKLKKVFKCVLPLKVEMLGGLQGFCLATDNKGIYWERLDGIETQAFDKQFFLSASSWSKDLRYAIKQGNPNDNVYDMYVYATCLLEHLSIRMEG